MRVTNKSESHATKIDVSEIRDSRDIKSHTEKCKKSHMTEKVLAYLLFLNLESTVTIDSGKFLFFSFSTAGVSPVSALRQHPPRNKTLRELKGS